MTPGEGWESDFTAAWALVGPLPGWLSERPARLLYGAVRSRQSPTVVEIGAYLGKSTVLLGLAAEKVNGIVYTIDPFDGRGSELYRVPYEYASRFDFFQHAVAAATLTCVRPIIATSDEANKKWGQVPIDVLYIDGDHEQAAVTRDVLSWTPRIVRGGLLIMDDYNQIGPRSAFDTYITAPEWIHKVVVAPSPGGGGGGKMVAAQRALT